jgi:hypothetical protein
MRKLVFFAILCFLSFSNSNAQFKSSIQNDNNKILKLKSSKIELKLDNFNSKDTILINKIAEVPKQDFGRFVGQYFAGIGLGSLSFVVVFFPLAALDKGAFNITESGHSNGMATVAFVVGSAAFIGGSALGVWGAGNTDGFTASPTWTILGGVAGVPVCIASGIGFSHLIENSKNGWLIPASIMTCISMIPIGSIIGFNATRTYNPENDSNSGASLFCYKKNYFRVSIPEMHLERDKTVKQEPITFLNILNINF